MYRCNCTITETSKKRTILRYLYSPSGRTERQRPAYGGFSNAIVCVSYHQHPIMAEEERGQERGSHEGENLRGEGKAPLERLPLSPWVVSLVHSSNVINRNSEPEKCCPTNSTIGSLLSMINTKTCIIRSIPYNELLSPPSRRVFILPCRNPSASENNTKIPENCFMTLAKVFNFCYNVYRVGIGFDLNFHKK